METAARSKLLKFPPEILSLIFMSTLPTGDNPDDWGDFLPTLLRLGRICSLWRKILHSTPELWATIVVSSPDSELNVSMTVFNWWIAKSGELPLSIWIEIGEEREAMADLLTLLFRHAERWKEVRITASHAFFFELGDHIARGSGIKVPTSLKVIQLKAFEDEVVEVPDDFTEDYTINFGGPISPSSLTLGSIPIAALSIRWTNLQHINAMVSMLEYITILQNCPLLISLRCGVYNTDLSQGNVVSHQSLTTLTLDDHKGLCTSKVLSFSSFPSLRHLTLENASNNFIAFISRCKPPLKSLRLISRQEIDDDELLQMLRLMGSLEELTFVRWNLLHSFFHAFDASSPTDVLEFEDISATTKTTEGNSMFLPSLQSLEITFGYPPKDPKNGFIGRCLSWVLNARADPAATTRRPLSRIRIAFEENLAEQIEIDQDTLNDVKQFNEKGSGQVEETEIRITDRLERDVLEVASELINATQKA